MKKEANVLFVCVENSNRSQMAEAFMRHHAGAEVHAFSAGSNPSGVVNPKAIASMAERGIDLTKNISKGLDTLPDITWDHVVTMGCGDNCPWLKTLHRDDWALADPKHMPPDEFAAVRDEIERRVVELLNTIRKGQS